MHTFHDALVSFAERRDITMKEAPLAGAWIEILIYLEWKWPQHWSPSRRGVNWNIEGIHNYTPYIEAPLAGAWIEILWLQDLWTPCQEAPLAGAWIEICSDFHVSPAFLKPLSQGRELKLRSDSNSSIASLEAPLAGAWIEMHIWHCLSSCYSEAPLAGAWMRKYFNPPSEMGRME